MARMKKGTKQILLIGGLAVGGFVAYRWWEGGRQAAGAEQVGYYPSAYGYDGGVGGGGGFGGFGLGLLDDCGLCNLGFTEEEKGAPLTVTPQYPSVPADLEVPPGVTPSDWWQTAYGEALKESTASGYFGDTEDRAKTLSKRIRLGAITREAARKRAREKAPQLSRIGQQRVAAYQTWAAEEAKVPRGTTYSAGLQAARGLTGYPATPISTPSMDIIRKAAAKSRLDFQKKRGATIGGLSGPSLPVGESLAAKRAAGAITRASAREKARASAIAVTTLAAARVAEYQRAAATAARKPTAYSRVQPTVGLTTGYQRTPTISPVLASQIKEQRVAAALHNI